MSTGGDRADAEAGHPPAPSPRGAYRLKRSIEVFPAADGRLYLMRPGTGEDFAITEPTPAERVIVDYLATGFQTREELRRNLERRGLPGAGLDLAVAQLDDLGLVEWQLDHRLLPQRQTERYDRQLIYWSDLAPSGHAAEDLQHRIGESTVVILGCGGLGSWAAGGLACAGIGRLVLIDHDRVELSNLNRQLLFSEADIGRLKVQAAADALIRHNSDVEIVPVSRLVSGPDDLSDLLDEAGLLIATADWPPYQLLQWVNEACLEANVPYVSAGQFPPRVRVGPMVAPGRSACYECAARQTRRDHPLFDELAARIPRSSPAATLGAASGVAGSLLAMEALHLLTGAAEPTTIDNAVLIDLLALRLSRERVVRDPDCPACG